VNKINAKAKAADFSLGLKLALTGKDWVKAHSKEIKETQQNEDINDSNFPDSGFSYLDVFLASRLGSFDAVSRLMKAKGFDVNAKDKFVPYLLSVPACIHPFCSSRLSSLVLSSPLPQDGRSCPEVCRCCRTLPRIKASSSQRSARVSLLLASPSLYLLLHLLSSFLHQVPSGILQS
jgi:hypothetical protein